MKNVLISFIFLAIFSSAAWGQLSNKPIQTFILKDGSRVEGQLMGTVNGTYIVQTKDSSQVKFLASDLQNMTTGHLPQPKAQTNPYSGSAIPAVTTQQMILPQDSPTQHQMFDTKAIEQKLQQLHATQQGSQGQEGVAGLDLTALQNNPAIAQLLQNKDQLMATMQNMQNQLTTNEKSQQGTDNLLANPMVQNLLKSFNQFFQN